MGQMPACKSRVAHAVVCSGGPQEWDFATRSSNVDRRQRLLTGVLIQPGARSAT